jgi:putative heme uptake system protein
VSEERVTYLVLDGENVDATLGGNVLGRRPAPDERPRWEKVLDHARKVWQQPVRALFFLNASSGQLPMPFVQALMAIGYRPVPLSGPAGVKVVDVGIQRTLDAIVPRDADVILASHDGDFLPQMRSLATGSRRVALLGFPEFVSSAYSEIPGLQVIDLERDARAFTKPLPRLRIIELDAFDPAEFL